MNKLGSELNQLDNHSALHGQEKQTRRPALLKCKRKIKRRGQHILTLGTQKGSLTEFMILLITNLFYIS